MGSVRRKRQLRRRSTGPALAALSLATPSIAENAAAGTLVGAVLGATAGSALSLVDSAGGRFALSGASLVVGATGTDHETATGHTVTIRETLAGYANSPRDTALTIAVTNVFEAPVLAGLSLSSASFAIGTPAFGTILGATAGSSIAADGLPPGLSVDGAARTWAWSGIGALGPAIVTLTETLADSANSPRASAISAAVVDSAVYLTADNGDRLVNDNSDPFILEAA